MTIPASKRNDPALEAEAKKQFPEFEYAKGATLRQVSFTISDWPIKRHEITNDITQREMDVYLGYRAADGQCYRVFGVFYEKYNNGSYTAPDLRTNTPELMNCNNLK